ncbi:hypothetical protein ACFQ0B_07550 [Nonomuraea thailandensis]
MRSFGLPRAVMAMPGVGGVVLPCSRPATCPRPASSTSSSPVTPVRSHIWEARKPTRAALAL